jgi:alkane 1-monooxygenase
MMMKKKLATWDRDFATEGELEIAARINEQAGYTMPENHDSYARI